MMEDTTSHPTDPLETKDSTNNTVENTQKSKKEKFKHFFVTCWKWFLDKVLLCGRPTDAPFFVIGDLDGFFALFMNTLLDFTLVISMGYYVVGLDLKLIEEQILPGAALVTLIGNLAYTWEARYLMRKENRSDVTAQPFGIATPSLVAFFNLIMYPLIHDFGLTPSDAYQVALFGNFISGIVMFAGILIGNWIRNYFPRAALLSGLAGIGIALISMSFVLQTFAKPMLAILPMLIFLFMLCSNTRLPYGIPYGIVMIAVGTALGWILVAIGNTEFQPDNTPLILGYFYPRVIFSFLSGRVTNLSGRYMTIIIPLAIINLAGTIQNLASAESAGDRFSTRFSIIVVSSVTSLGAFFGNPFPTTLYIGHPLYKTVGSRALYSALNGVIIIILCSFGGIGLILRAMPQEAIMPVLLFIGMGITAEGFAQVPKRHGVAVAFGLLPSLGTWTLSVVSVTVDKAKQALGSAGDALTVKLVSQYFGSQFYFNGVCALSEGFLLTSMLLSATLVFFIDHQFMDACIVLLALAVFSWIGLIHAFTFDERTGAVSSLFVGQNGTWIAAPEFTISYGIFSAFMLTISLISRWRKRRRAKNDEAVVNGGEAGKSGDASPTKETLLTKSMDEDDLVVEEEDEDVDSFRYVKSLDKLSLEKSQVGKETIRER